MYLEEIIDDIQMESDRFECKSMLNRDDVIRWLKSIAGFANASGGDFYIGVRDKANKLVGFDRKSDSTCLRRQVLGNLERSGYLEQSKISRAMFYKTNRDMAELR